MAGGGWVDSGKKNTHLEEEEEDSGAEGAEGAEGVRVTGRSVSLARIQSFNVRLLLLSVFTFVTFLFIFPAVVLKMK